MKQVYNYMTLYRKYRPQTFSDLTGQEHIVQTITNEIALNKLAHAYLFSGPRGVGKTTLARLLAKAANCPGRKEGTSEPCGVCGSCQEITAGCNIDVIEIDAASQTGVENVRDNIIDNVQFAPTKSKYKIFIIDEVHMLSGSSFNALLKTLEEPPAHIIFILATTELHKLPATVVSRCQRFGFKKIPRDLMLARLKNICAEEKVKVDKEVLERIVAKSEGGLRDAESLLGQIVILSGENESASGGKKITIADAAMILPAASTEAALNFIEQLINLETAPALKLLSALAANGANLNEFARETLEIMRLAMLLRANAENAELTGAYADGDLKRLRKLALAMTPVFIIELIDALIRRRAEITPALLPQLPLELLVIEFTQRSKSETPNPPNPETAAVDKTVPEEKPAPAPRALAATIKQAFSSLTRHGEPVKTTLEEIKAVWQDLLADVSASNPSLTFILKMCSLHAIADNQLVLNVPYQLHKDKLDEQKNRNLIENFFKQRFSERIPLLCRVAVESAPADADLSALALEFGGEVVG